MAGERRSSGLCWALRPRRASCSRSRPCPRPAQILDPPSRGVETPQRRRKLRPDARPPMPTPLDAEERRSPSTTAVSAADAGASGRAGRPRTVDTDARAAQDGDTPRADDAATTRTTLSARREARPRRARRSAGRRPGAGDRGAGARSDGVIDLSEPSVAAESEEDITAADMRSPEDSRPSPASRPASIRCCSQAEEINPVFGDSSFRHFGLDPFAPLGTRIGSFMLFTTVEADGDYNSNLFASPEAVGDTALEVRPSARLASNWSRHALELRASGDLSFHDRFPSEDDRAYLVEASARLDMTQPHQYPGPDRARGGAGKPLGDQRQLGRHAARHRRRPRRAWRFNHRFNRLSVQLRGNVIDTRYGNDIFDGHGRRATPTATSRSTSRRCGRNGSSRPTCSCSPTSPSTSATTRSPPSPTASSAARRASATASACRSARSSQILRGEVSLGYGRQTPDSPQLEVIDGLLIDANLTWQRDAADDAAVHRRDRRGGNDDRRLGRRHGAQYGARGAPQLHDAPRRHRRPRLL